MTYADALAVVGLAKSSHHNRHHPRPSKAQNNPTPHHLRSHWRLSDDDREEIMQLIDQGRRNGKSITQIYREHLDNDNQRYLGSLRSFYRCEHHAIHTGRYPDRRIVAPTQRTQRTRTVPEVVATAPGQVIVWDITWIKGYYTTDKWPMYVFMDLYSRKVVGFTIQHAETGRDAADLLTEILTDINDQPVETVRIVHSDNGGPMTSKEIRGVLATYNITQSLSRPSVSNDNPHIESQHRTSKHHRLARMAELPKTIDDAYRVYTAVFNTYNTIDYHSGLGGYTPQSVWDGTWKHIAEKRHAKLKAYATQHPHRHTQTIHIPTPPKQTEINPPKPETTTK